MKKLLLIIMIALVGCESPIEDSNVSDVVVYPKVKTVNIGLKARQYDIVETYDSYGNFYKVYNVDNGSYIDTMYIDVPDGEITMMFHYIDRIEPETYEILVFEPVADSVYQFRF